MCGQRKWVDAPIQLPSPQTSTQVGFDAGRGLIAVLYRLREKLHHDGRKRIGNPAGSLTRRISGSRNVAVDPLHRIGGGKRKTTGEHLVKCDAEGVEVAS